MEPLTENDQFSAGLDVAARGPNTLVQLFDALADAARRGPDQLLHTVEKLLPQHVGIQSAHIIVKQGSDWRLWSGSTQDMPDEFEYLLSDAGSNNNCPPSDLDGALCLTIRKNEIGLVGLAIDGEPLPADELALCAHYLETAVSWPPPMEALRQDVTATFGRLANTILHSEDLPEIFFNITEVAKNELAADISGIMLLEDQRLVMQRCVGHDSTATARLEMEAGQGVGGRVLDTGDSCVVENYVASSHISQDFFDLARIEKVRSALAAPLRSKHRIIGVLEVWRRRPSTFSAGNVTTLETLADLASIAIANVSRVEAQNKTLDELETANVTIKKRNDVIERSAAFQQKLMQCLLDDFELDEIVSSAAEGLESGVFVFDAETGLRAQHGSDQLTASDLKGLPRELAVAAPLDETAPIECTLGNEGPTVLAQCLSALPSQRGWVGIVNHVGSREWNLLALASISMTIAFHDMKSQAASAALSEKTSTLVWDLFDPSENIRRLAVDRLRELGIDMNRDSCVALCGLNHCDSASEQGLPSDRDFDIYRWLTRHVSARGGKDRNKPCLASKRGNEVAIVLPWRNAQAAVSLVHDIEDQVATITPGVTCATGISAKCDDPLLLRGSLSEARLARKVAEMTASTHPVLFEETGLIGIMMQFQEGMDFQDLAAHTLKTLADESVPQSATLRQTLHQFLSLNCHQGHTAEALGIHPKTVAYRIERIEDAVELDLKCHEHRMLLEIALKSHDLGGSKASA